MTADDARISIMAATMSIRIQQALEMNLDENAEIIFIKSDENYSLNTKIYPVPDFIEIPPERERKAFISKPVINQMRELMRNKMPNEQQGECF